MLGKTVGEANTDMKCVYGDGTTTLSAVSKWYARYEESVQTWVIIHVPGGRKTGNLWPLLQENLRMRHMPQRATLQHFSSAQRALSQGY